MELFSLPWFGMTHRRLPPFVWPSAQPDKWVIKIPAVGVLRSLVFPYFVPLPKHVLSRSCCVLPWYYFPTPISLMVQWVVVPSPRSVVSGFLTAKPTSQGWEGPLLVPPIVEYWLCPWFYVSQFIFLFCYVPSSLHLWFPYQKISPNAPFLAEFGPMKVWPHTPLLNEQKKMNITLISREINLCFAALALALPSF